MESKNVTYLERLDHVRFFAAAMVLLFHTALWLANDPQMKQKDAIKIALIDLGHTGVPLFMVISGMILTIIVNDKEIMVGRFYKNRILRIYPLYIVMVSLGYFASKDPRPTSVGIDYLMSLLPISNLYRLNYGGETGGQLWSVAVELQFYLIFPFLMMLRNRRGIRYLLGCIGMLLFVRLGAYRINHDPNALAFSLFGTLDIFLIGMMAGEIYLWCRDRKGWWQNKYLFLGYFVAVNAFFYLPIPWGGRKTVVILLPTVQAVIWATFVVGYLVGDFKVPLSAFWARLGKYSYSIYVWHMFVLLLVLPGAFRYFTPYSYGALVVLPVTVIVAAVSYHLIEEPFFAFRVRYTVDPNKVDPNTLLIPEVRKQAA